MEVVYEMLLSVAIKIDLYSHFCRFWNRNKLVFTYEIRSISSTDNACSPQFSDDNRHIMTSKKHWLAWLSLFDIGSCLQVVGVIFPEYAWTSHPVMYNIQGVECRLTFTWPLGVVLLNLAGMIPNSLSHSVSPSLLRLLTASTLSTTSCVLPTLV